LIIYSQNNCFVSFVVQNAFTTSISEVARAYEKVSSSSSATAAGPQSSLVEEKLDMLNGDLDSDMRAAVMKLQVCLSKSSFLSA
jgi:hypothetical protein